MVIGLLPRPRSCSAARSMLNRSLGIVGFFQHNVKITEDQDSSAKPPAGLELLYRVPGE